MIRFLQWIGLVIFVVASWAEMLMTWLVAAMKSIVRRVRAWCCRCCQPDPRFVIRVSGLQDSEGFVRKTPQYQSAIPHGASIIMQMNTLQQVTLSVAPKDRRGNPAAVEAPEWLTDNSDILSLTPSSDGLSCLVKAVGIPGTAGVVFKCDGLVGEGANPIQSNPLDFDIVSAPATMVDIVAGTVEEQPD